MKLASKPQARELVIKHCLPAQIQCNFSDQASRSRAPTCFPATHCLVLQTTFSPQYWTKHPCSVGSGESVAIDLLHSLVGKCWEGISWLPWGEKSYMRSILKVFQVTGKPDCLEGNNQKSIRTSARHLVIIISFFFLVALLLSHLIFAWQDFVWKAWELRTWIPASFLLLTCHLAWSKIFIILYIHFWRYHED